jgi:hypothetical protein
MYATPEAAVAMVIRVLAEATRRASVSISVVTLLEMFGLMMSSFIDKSPGKR